MNPELEKAALDVEEVGCLKETDRAIRARQIIDNPLWREAFQKVDDTLRNELMAAETGDIAMAKLNAIDMLSQIEKMFKEALETGKLASAQLDIIEGKRKKLGLFEKLRRVS